MNHYKIWLDGGSKGSDKRNSVGYGSYYFQNVDKDQSVIKRMEFNAGMTCNEAEWTTLMSVLKTLMGAYDAEVELFMDSKLVVNQFNERWKCKDNRMKNYRDNAHALKSKLEKRKVKVKLSWVPRSNIEVLLGH